MGIVGKLDTALSGQPDKTLTIILLAIGLASIVVALYARPSVKAGVLTWELLP